MRLARQQVALARRHNREFLIFFADLDNMKWINDNLGHRAGDQALIDVANLISENFRCSDVIGRFGGDEFAVLAIEAISSSTRAIIERIKNKLSEFNSKKSRNYDLSLSIGVAHYSPESPCSIDELLDRADRSMYEHKQQKQIFN